MLILDKTLVGRGSYKGNNFIANNSSLEGKFLKIWNDVITSRIFKYLVDRIISYFYDPINLLNLAPYGSKHYWPNFDLTFPGLCPTNLIDSIVQPNFLGYRFSHRSISFPPPNKKYHDKLDQAAQ